MAQPTMILTLHGNEIESYRLAGDPSYDLMLAVAEGNAALRAAKQDALVTLDVSTESYVDEMPVTPDEEATDIVNNWLYGSLVQWQDFDGTPRCTSKGGVLPPIDLY